MVRGVFPDNLGNPPSGCVPTPDIAPARTPLLHYVLSPTNGTLRTFSTYPPGNRSSARRRVWWCAESFRTISEIRHPVASQQRILLQLVHRFCITSSARPTKRCAHFPRILPATAHPHAGAFGGARSLSGQSQKSAIRLRPNTGYCSSSYTASALRPQPDQRNVAHIFHVSSRQPLIRTRTQARLVVRGVFPDNLGNPPSGCVPTTDIAPARRPLLHLPDQRNVTSSARPTEPLRTFSTYPPGNRSSARRQAFGDARSLSGQSQKSAIRLRPNTGYCSSSYTAPETGRDASESQKTTCGAISLGSKIRPIGA